MRFRIILLAPILAFVALGAWAYASPVGSSPDDDHHLISIWCADGNEANCLPGTSAANRYVPEPFSGIACFAYDEERSAACQTRAFADGSAPTYLTDRGNFRGGYPPVYYATMGLFATPDILASAVAMRFINIALFVGITTALFVLLPIRRRPLLLWGWLITMVPLGLFLIASNNPSGWSITGVGSAWIALLGYFETTGRRRIALGALFALSVVMAAGSRADAAFFTIGGIAVVLILKFMRSRAFLLSAILPVAGLIVAAAFFATSGQIGAGIDGFTKVATASAGASTAEAPVDAFALLAYNLINLPYLWTGIFGGWGLGWLDTILPWLVVTAGTAVFVGVGFTGLSKMDWRKIAVVGGVGFVLIALPLYVLTKGGDGVGANVQPRYLLPLIVMLAGLLLFEPVGRRIRFTRLQLVVVAVALAASNFIALQTNIRRYVTGTDSLGLNLNDGAEWWWSAVPFSPMVIWIVGSLAFAGAAAILIWETRRTEEAPELVPAGLSSGR